MSSSKFFKKNAVQNYMNAKGFQIDASYYPALDREIEKMLKKSTDRTLAEGKKRVKARHL